MEKDTGFSQEGVSPQLTQTLASEPAWQFAVSAHGGRNESGTQ